VHLCLQSYTSFTLILPLYIIYFLHLLSTNHKCNQLCYFSHTTQTCYSELKKIWSTLKWCSRQAIAPDQLPVELWCLFAAMLPKVFDLVFCKILFGNNYYILWYWLFCIYFLYGMCVNLIHVHPYYEYSVWP
jgi:hypothetical protein